MTLQQLEYIVAIDTHRHFVTAAEKCFVTQPTLTMQVKKLENEIGLPIFDRSKHPTEPTTMGEKIIVKARQVLREANQLKELISSDKQSIEGTFSLGIIPTVAPYLLARFIGKFTNKYPKTRLIVEELKSEEIISRLKNDTLHIGILATPLDDKSIREIPLYNEPFLFYGQPKHPAHKVKNLTSTVLKTNELWLLNQGHCFREQLVNICTSAKKTQHAFEYESGSIESLKQMVQYNGGYTLVPQLAISSLDKGFVKPFSSPQPSREISLIVHNSYTKEALLNNIHAAIIDAIPDTLVKRENYIRVKWR
jgi:LysR family transcriptional regulator, hydrogen peroxide-inducible genes activator